MARPTKYVCIHGHYYQPPRENPWLGVIEQQETARPYHDWNDRINFECYAPNAAARILDEQGYISKIRNNYNRISFDFGPTLLSWLEEEDRETYALILQADKKSQTRFGGHGSAMAQAHSHLILPLCNYRDKVTQVVWGVRDFEFRFGRTPEGMWLAETAVDVETLEVLAAHGVRYTVLAPRQARAVRRLGVDGADWHGVNADTVDTRVPYWCLLPSGRRIALYFYNGTVSQEVAFNGLLNSGRLFARRLMNLFDHSDTPQLVHIATDGESYGHHHRFGEMALADCLNQIEQSGDIALTNYGEFLELFPPEFEVQIHEGTSWSCVHGVERWRNDCGCHTGGQPTWNQRWRAPLRASLNWLRDQLAPIFEREAGRLLRDPWAARNDYIELMLYRTEPRTRAFLDRHTRRALSQLEEVMVLRLLEMQRHALLMYTSCGWFFDEVSGIETTQILQYALRAIDYAYDVGGVDLNPEFIKRLRDVPSNVYDNGAVHYQQNVIPRRVTLERVAMHFAVASLFEPDPASLDLFYYTATVESFEKIVAGTPQFAVGRITVRSRLTGADRTFSFAVLYLGQQHIIGNISGGMNRTTFEAMRRATTQSFRSANLGDIIGVLQQYFGPEKFTLASLLADEKIKIIRSITANSLVSAEASFRNVFNENYQLMTGLQDVDMPLPDAWHNIASYVLNADLLHFFRQTTNYDTRHLHRVAEDMKRWNVRLYDEETVRHAIHDRLYREIARLELDESSLPRVRWLNDVIAVVFDLGLRPRIWRIQNVYYLITKPYRKGLVELGNDEWQRAFERLGELLKVRLKLVGQPASQAVA
jgi:alpha-amylase/alpha-mannosidase (GH57 family)